TNAEGAIRHTYPAWTPQDNHDRRRAATPQFPAAQRTRWPTARPCSLHLLQLAHHPLPSPPTWSSILFTASSAANPATSRTSGAQVARQSLYDAALGLWAPRPSLIDIHPSIHCESR